MLNVNVIHGTNDIFKQDLEGGLNVEHLSGKT